MFVARKYIHIYIHTFIHTYRQTDEQKKCYSPAFLIYECLNNILPALQLRPDRVPFEYEPTQPADCGHSFSVSQEDTRYYIQISKTGNL